MEMEGERGRMALPRFFTFEMAAFTLAIISGLTLLWALTQPDKYLVIVFGAGVVFTICVAVIIRLAMDPDSVRARQSDAMLQLASQTLECMSEGITAETAPEMCELLLPSSAAIAVAITDTERILGYAGYQEAENPSGATIRTQATRDTLKDGKMRILHSAAEIGFPSKNAGIRAAIIVPLSVGKDVVGTLKFYYRDSRYISETQKSIAMGLGQLLSTQMAAVAMEDQKKAATNMELKMLQSQINPHFLFNTINTIASLIRTNPNKARVLLREFAAFYRRTLEDPGDLIELSREMEQTRRYFAFEIARFGSERLELVEDIDPELEEMLVPPFLLQPLVENAVRHALPSEGKLTIRVVGTQSSKEVRISVIDDGIGMTEEARQSIMHPESATGLGIAVKNVHDRIHGFFGQEAHMDVQSALGHGTTVSLVLPRAAVTKAKAVEAVEAGHVMGALNTPTSQAQQQ